jgi:hypothetical protein
MLAYEALADVVSNSMQHSTRMLSCCSGDANADGDRIRRARLHEP